MTTAHVGRCYFRRKDGPPSVRKILRFDGDLVYYEVLHGPARTRNRFGKCSLKNFRRWAMSEIAEKSDYSYLDGAIIHETFLVQNTQGEVIFRCSAHRARFYLRKGYAVEVGDKLLRLTDDTTEKRLRELYGDSLSEFFMEVKNDKCVVCGGNKNLTHHHVVPKRFKPMLTLPQRASLSNVLFLCWPCHKHYEDHDFEHDVTDPYAWRDHFLRVMLPQYMPKGWDIVTVRNLDALQERKDEHSHKE